MSKKTVGQLAEIVKIPLDRLLVQLKEAGVSATKAEDEISEEEKTKLLAHLRKRHGTEAENLPNKVVLKRRKVSELTQSSTPGSATKTISVEVRKEKTYIKREQVVPEITEVKITSTIEVSEVSVIETQKLVNVDETTQVLAVASDSAKKRAIVEDFELEELKVVANVKSELTDLEYSQKLQREKEQRLEDSINRTAERVRANAAAKLNPPVQRPRNNNSGAPSNTASRPNNAARPNNNSPRTNANANTSALPNNVVVASPVANTAAARAAANANAPARVNAPPRGTNTPPRGSSTVGARGNNNAGGGAGNSANGNRNDGNRKKKKGKNAKQPSRNVIQNDGKHQFEMPVAQMVYEVTVPEMISVADLANKMNVKAALAIKHLMKLGIMATINQTIDQDTAAILVEDMGHTPIMQSDDDFEKEMLAEVTEDESYPELPRAPIVTIMGHVDHGKTSLLDYIRKTRVAAGEAGGITQHIGAYQVKTDHGSVTFLDTPGHAAFTAMRARGADVTDVVIIVVAADDGVMPQTKEAVEHARAANVPIIVALNKMDKPGANPDKVMQELSVLNVLAEEWGGDVQFLKISAKTGEGVDDLIESLIVQTEILELKAPVAGAASGIVIESRLDRGRGAVATILVQRGTLESGQMVLCGQEYGRVRAMFNENGKTIKTAGPCEPVEILGLSSTPNAGDEFLVVQNERVAKELAKHREDRKRLKRHAEQATSLEDVFNRMKAGEQASLNLVLKTDVQGSLEALRSSLIDLSNDEVTVKVVYGGVGGINEGDVNLALASGAILMGFNVRADATSRRMIEERGVDLHYYSIIYEAIDEVKKSISGMLAPEIKEQFMGLAEVRDVFKSPKLGAIAGCMVLDGVVKRNLPIRVLRENVVVYEGVLESLRRFKDDVSEVKMGMECGIGVKNYNDIRDGDQIEVFERIEVRREL
ncbi:MAG: translation initiation factor IF-2 [Methylococcales bacterium]|nr:translation initiation factor IF-2 [Methylococcales bacterium]